MTPWVRNLFSSFQIKTSPTLAKPKSNQIIKKKIENERHRQ
jgi:hypothetical protein